MTEAFTRNFEINEEFIKNIGNGFTLSYKVHGYWSGSSISVYIRRDWCGSNDWRFEVSHSSGGRDNKEVAEDSQAAINFGLAMLDAGNLIKNELEPLVPQFEASYQAYCERLRIEAAEDRARKERILLADPAVGNVEASKVVANMLGGSIQALVITTRGENPETRWLRVLRTQGGQRKVVMWRDQEMMLNDTYGRRGHWMIRAKAVEMISESSAANMGYPSVRVA